MNIEEQKLFIFSIYGCVPVKWTALVIANLYVPRVF